MGVGIKRGGGSIRLALLLLLGSFLLLLLLGFLGRLGLLGPVLAIQFSQQLSLGFSPKSLRQG